MFGGAYELSIDSKGRLAIPAKFRDLLARHFTPVLVA
ncbi:MAG: cell division/cell wall cluster transcriptional repressor MraZ, partial [Snodgrassella alvi]|nr:cell division/cell wall cluster transcriptional repressor MraZ [Snodgrassella alvi]